MLGGLLGWLSAGLHGWFCSFCWLVIDVVSVSEWVDVLIGYVKRNKSNR